MNNNDIILKADNLYFLMMMKKHSLNGLPWRFQEARNCIYGCKWFRKSTFFLCCTGIHKPSSGLFIIMGNLILMTVKGF